MGIIILEGCDCTGKTTLAQMLSERLGYEIVKGSSFEISQMGREGMANHMDGLLDRDNIIIDRFYMSNYVYGNLYDYPLMDDLDFLLLSVKAEGTQNALMIYVTAEPHTIKERMAKRGDDDVKADEVDAILEKYQEGFGLVKTMQSKFLVLNTTAAHVADSIDMIKGFMEVLDRDNLDKSNN